MKIKNLQFKIKKYFYKLTKKNFEKLKNHLNIIIRRE